MNEGFEIEGRSEKDGAIAAPSVNKSHASLSSLTDDPEIKQDCEFLDRLQNIITDCNTSKLFIPYLSQFRATYQKARRSLKKRIEVKSPENKPRNPQEFERRRNTGNRDFQTVITPDEELSTWNGLPDTEGPDVNQYWEVSNGKDSLYVYIVEKNPFMVQFFELNARGDSYRLNDLKFEVLIEDLVRKVDEPQMIPVGKSRVNYIF